MKLSTYFVGVASCLSTTALAAPNPIDAGIATAPVQKRAVDISHAYAICESLYSGIKQYTGAINTTSASLTPTSPQTAKDAATKNVGTQLKGITTLVNSATAQVKGTKREAAEAEIEERQAAPAPSAGDLAALVTNIILEISGALNGIIADLGLQPLLAFLTPLVGSLSGLLLSLELVVNNLLALVQALVDGLLTGLSIGLAGLIL